MWDTLCVSGLLCLTLKKNFKVKCLQACMGKKYLLDITTLKKFSQKEKTDNFFFLNVPGVANLFFKMRLNLVLDKLTQK